MEFDVIIYDIPCHISGRVSYSKGFQFMLQLVLLLFELIIYKTVNNIHAFPVQLMEPTGHIETIKIQRDFEPKTPPPNAKPETVLCPAVSNRVQRTVVKVQGVTSLNFHAILARYSRSTAGRHFHLNNNWRIRLSGTVQCNGGRGRDRGVSQQRPKNSPNLCCSFRIAFSEEYMKSKLKINPRVNEFEFDGEGYIR